MGDCGRGVSSPCRAVTPAATRGLKPLTLSDPQPAGPLGNAGAFCGGGQLNSQENAGPLPSFPAPPRGAGPGTARPLGAHQWPDASLTALALVRPLAADGAVGADGQRHRGHERAPRPHQARPPRVRAGRGAGGAAAATVARPAISRLPGAQDRTAPARPRTAPRPAITARGYRLEVVHNAGDECHRFGVEADAGARIVGVLGHGCCARHGRLRWWWGCGTGGTGHPDGGLRHPSRVHGGHG